MLVHIAFATLLAAAPRREGTQGKMRRTPIANAIRDTKSTSQNLILASHRLRSPIASSAGNPVFLQ
ncbi:MAG: hypothetical protein HY719_09250 [Planctomycetes bacterium]|nr:hypothetical protein [Planctomycetota bacterium]